MKKHDGLFVALISYLSAVMNQLVIHLRKSEQQPAAQKFGDAPSRCLKAEAPSFQVIPEIRIIDKQSTVKTAQ